MSSVRLLIVDDHAIVRSGIRFVLASFEARIVVVGEAGDAEGAYREAAAVAPDVVLLDFHLPDARGDRVAAELGRRQPGVRILVFSAESRRDHAQRALDAGAGGYLLKDADADELAAAILEVAAGGRYLPLALDSASGDASEREAAPRPAGPASSLSLSPREREVYDLLVRGFTNEGVAARLFISVRTVETHRAHIFRRLRVHSLAELVRRAAMEGEPLE